MKNLSRVSYVAPLGGLGLLLSGGAFAAVPADVSTALTTAATDAGTAAGLVLLVMVAIFGFRAIKRAIG